MPPLTTQIETWAAGRNLPWVARLPVASADQTAFLLLDDDNICGEIKVSRVRAEPASYFVSVCRGNLILEEIWTDDHSLPAHLDWALRSLQGRVKSAVPQWGLAFSGAAQ